MKPPVTEKTFEVDPIQQPPREWLKIPEIIKDERPHIRLTMAQYGNTGTCNKFTIENLTKAEADAIQGFLNGTSWIRCVNGRLNACSAIEPLPGPEADPICGPHWRTDGEPKMWGGIPDGEGWHLPGIVITALGAGLGPHTFGGQEKARKANQKRVQECGFVCMRSPRGDDGKYWEQWVLNSLWSAAGPLKEHLKQFKETLPRDMKERWHQEVNEACRFLAEDMRISFGSMDVTIQRWALCNPD